MTRIRPRESRVRVVITARLRSNAGWADVRISDLSPGGMGGEAPVQLQRGQYVEIRRHHTVVIGRIIWSDNGRFGLAAQDRIDIATVVDPSAPGARDNGDRRRQDRWRKQPPARRSTAEQAERSARFSRMFDFAAITALVVCGAATLGSFAYDAMARPLQQVSLAMRGQVSG